MATFISLPGAGQDLLLDPHVHLLTLTGSPGVGKTRLALEVAEVLSAGFERGAVFVDLSPISSPDMVASAIGQTLGVHGGFDDSTHRDEPRAAPRPVIELVKDYLREKNLLLVLDNFEQVVETAPQAGDLLAA